MAMTLSDDGTMDTVLTCDTCGQEVRFTYDGETDETENTVEQDEPGGYWRIRFHGEMMSAGYITKQAAENTLNEWLYEEWVKSCIEDAEQDHECPEDEPQEEDITTEDHRDFYYLGKRIVEVAEDEDWEPAVGAWCKANGYFPNVWLISDHGNACLISVAKDGRYLSGYAD